MFAYFLSILRFHCLSVCLSLLLATENPQPIFCLRILHVSNVMARILAKCLSAYLFIPSTNLAEHFFFALNDGLVRTRRMRRPKRYIFNNRIMIEYIFHTISHFQDHGIGCVSYIHVHRAFCIPTQAHMLSIYDGNQGKLIFFLLFGNSE